MFRDRLRVVLAVSLFLTLFCTAGWLLPDHYCRLQSCEDCRPVQSCCEDNAPPDLNASEATCCFNVNGYYNFPVFFVNANPLKTELPVFIMDFAGARSPFHLAYPYIPVAPAKPPDIVLKGLDIYSVQGVFRI